jgi:hypothetical protein
MGNEMVAEEVGCSFYHIVECWHGFCPFGEVDNSNYDIFFPIVGWGVASHEINTPFEKGAYHNDSMEGEWVVL